jgi:hypothetical protein
VIRIKNCPNKGWILVKGELITKMQKWDEVIEKYSPREPLIQNSSDLHENFLT